MVEVFFESYFDSKIKVTCVFILGAIENMANGHRHMRDLTVTAKNSQKAKGTEMWPKIYPEC